jgi:alpha-tubulin suppressor-like RCC1 family protein
VDVAARFENTAGTTEIRRSDGVTWTSDNDSIIEVSAGRKCDGESAGGLHACLHGLAVGSATVSVSIHQVGIQDASASFKVRVNERWIEIAANRRNTCAVNARGKLFCWGGHLTLGNGSNGGKLLPFPVAVLGSQQVETIVSRDYTTCVKLVNIDTPYCWGDNQLGQAGLGPGLNSSRIPAPLFGGTGFELLGVGGAMSCGTTEGRGVLPFVTCWGRWTGNGLGMDPNIANKPGSRLFPFKKLAPLSATSCILRKIAYTCVFTPVGAFTSHTLALAVGRGHACAVAQDPYEPAGDERLDSIAHKHPEYATLMDTAVVWCWGSDTAGQLGRQITDPLDSIPLLDGTYSHESSPRVGVRLPTNDLSLLSAIDAIGAGAAHTCASLASGPTYCWGSNDLGQSGAGSDSISVPTLVPGLAGIKQITAGTGHTCALDAGGQARCWGYNTFDALGAQAGGTCNSDSLPLEAPGDSLPQVGHLQCSPTAVPVEGGYTFTKLAAGSWHTCGITVPEGAIICWGFNDWGQLGIGVTDSSPHLPQRVLEPDAPDPATP